MRGVSEEHPAPFPWWRGENRIMKKNGAGRNEPGRDGLWPVLASARIQKKKSDGTEAVPILKQGRPILSCSGQDTVGSSWPMIEEGGSVERQNTASESLATPLFSLKAAVRGLVSVH
jgi:hypothetical protein